MTNSDSRIWEIQGGGGCVQKIRETIRKIKFPPGTAKRIADKGSYQSLWKPTPLLTSAMYDMDKVDISIVDDRFQAMVKDKGGENIKIELLKRSSMTRYALLSKNIKRMTNLKDELEKRLANTIRTLR